MAAGVAVRLVWIWIGSGDDRFLFADSSSYLDVAATLPGGFTATATDSLVASLYRTPGYPAFLWSLGGASSPALAIAGQALLGGAANVWLGHRLAHRLIGARAAPVAAVVMAFDPASVTHAVLIATETLTTTGLLVSGLLAHHLHGALRSGRPTLRLAVAAGGSLGLGALVRPSVAALPLLLAAALWVAVRTRQALACAVVIAAVGLVPPAVLVGRNASLAGGAALSTTQGQNLLDFGLAASVAGHHDLPLLPADRATMTRLTEAAYERDVPPADRAALAAVRRRPAGAAKALEINRLESEIGKELLARNPRGTVLVTAQAGVRSLTSSGHSGLNRFVSPSRWEQVKVPVAVTAGAWLVAFYAAITVGTVSLARARRWWVLTLTLGVAVAYLLTSAGPWLYVRFRVPVTPFLAVLVAQGVVALRTRSPGAGSDLDAAESSPLRPSSEGSATDRLSIADWLVGHDRRHALRAGEEVGRVEEQRRGPDVVAREPTPRA